VFLGWQRRGESDVNHSVLVVSADDSPARRKDRATASTVEIGANAIKQAIKLNSNTL
jgi:hypothetical protein